MSNTPESSNKQKLTTIELNSQKPQRSENIPLASSAGKENSNPTSIDHTRGAKVVYPLFAESPLHDPFVRHDSNVGRRRANAFSLINSPARRSHSQEMARLFVQAQEAVVFQDAAKKRSSEAKVAKATIRSPPRRPLNREPWEYSPGRTTPKTEPVFGTTHSSRPCLPAMSHMTRLSDDLPPHMRIETPVKRSPQKSPQSVPIRDRISKVPVACDYLYSPRVRPFKGIAKASIIRDAIDIEENSQMSASIDPLAEVDQIRPSLVQEWLDTVDQEEAALLEGMDAAFRDTLDMPNSPTVVSRAPTPPAQPSKLSKLMKPVALKFKLPKIPSPTQRYALATPTLYPTNTIRTRPKRTETLTTSPSTTSSPANLQPTTHIRKTSSSSGASGSSAKERQGWERLPSASPGKGFASDVEPLMSFGEDGGPVFGTEVEGFGVVEEFEVKALTPEVERFRKGRGPARRRCASYFDGDVL